MENTERETAWSIIENTGMSLFLTGKAGTGKTTFLRKLVEESKKRLVVLAPTGIAAINAGGVTIHSFFQLPFSPYIPGSNPTGSKFHRLSKQKVKMIRSLDLIVIDEVSMVRADLLDAIDAVLRRVRKVPIPFGGVQLLLIGDLQQLPPVATESDIQLLQPYYPSFYFFESHALRSMRYEMVELRKIYRQNDEEFISILNAIRDNKADSSVLARLNTRFLPGFEVPSTPKYIRLTTHNELARRVNDDHLYRLPGEEWTHRAKVDGAFPESSYPADSELRLKEGAQVMFVKNDSSGTHRYYNGMIGTMESLSEGCVYVRPEGALETLKIQPESWDNTSYVLDPATSQLKEQIDGTFSQFPLRLAWAITIHKSQGLTFSHAVIDASRSFAHGQAYVALSRCKNMEGLVLERPLTPAAVICDRNVTAFMADRAAKALSAEQVKELADNYRISLLDELFDFLPARNSLADCRHVVEEAFAGIYPNLVKRWRVMEAEFSPRLVDVGRKFGAQYRSLLSPDGDSGRFPERLSAACGYFFDEIKRIREVITDTPLEVDNARVAKVLAERIATFSDQVMVKQLLFGEFRGGDFSVEKYLKAKAKAMMQQEESARKKIAPASGQGAGTSSGKKTKEWVSTNLDDLSNPRLYRALQLWRREKMSELGVAAFMVLGTKVMKEISEKAPRSRAELLAVPGVGPKKADQFGEEILALVASTT